MFTTWHIRNTNLGSTRFLFREYPNKKNVFGRTPFPPSNYNLLSLDKMLIKLFTVQFFFLGLEN